MYGLKNGSSFLSTILLTIILAKWSADLISLLNISAHKHWLEHYLLRIYIFKNTLKMTKLILIKLNFLFRYLEYPFYFCLFIHLFLIKFQRLARRYRFLWRWFGDWDGGAGGGIRWLSNLFFQITYSHPGIGKTKL